VSALPHLSIDVEINLKSEVCPYIFVKSKLAIEDMEKGQILKVIVDHEPAVENVPRSLSNEGHEVINVSKINDADWQIMVRKA